MLSQALRHGSVRGKQLGVERSINVDDESAFAPDVRQKCAVLGFLLRVATGKSDSIGVDV